MLENTDVKELAIHRRVSQLSYSHRCADASAVQAYRIPVIISAIIKCNESITGIFFSAAELWGITIK
jgi:hypothetical protein